MSTKLHILILTFTNAAAGEMKNRIRVAIKKAGLKEVPVIIKNYTDQEIVEISIIENIQRENLGYMEEAEAFCTLLSEHGITQEELAERLGKNQSTIANKIRILKLSPQIRAILAEHNLSERHARALLKLNDEKSRLKALNIIVARGLNVSKSEEVVEGILHEGDREKVDKKTANLRIFKDIRIFSNTIRQAVDMMKKSGILAHTSKVENEEFIEYTIKIPKNMEKAV